MYCIYVNVNKYAPRWDKRNLSDDKGPRICISVSPIDPYHNMLLTKISTASYFLTDQGLIWISITQKMNISE